MRLARPFKLDHLYRQRVAPEAHVGGLPGKAVTTERDVTEAIVVGLTGRVAHDSRWMAVCRRGRMIIRNLEDRNEKFASGNDKTWQSLEAHPEVVERK